MGNRVVSTLLKGIAPLCLIVLLSGCGDIRYDDGVLADRQPRQERITKTPVFLHDDLLVRPVATFEIDARVLSKRRYRFGKSAKLAPVDFALGWGPMSDQANIDEVKISQSNRFYWWRTKRPPIPVKSISENSANMHLIPADKSVRKQLLKIRSGSLVTLTGYLVNVSSDNFLWTTSTTRTDTGNGACELVYVKEVVVHPGPE